MFGDWMLRLVAHLAGFSQAQLDRIGRAMPATRKLIAIAVKAEPLFQKAAPVLNELSPLIVQALPIMQKAMPLIEELMPVVTEANPLVQQAWKEFDVVGPVLSVVMSVIERDMAQGQSRDDVVKNVIAKVESAFGHRS
jgi:hypothetical protein